VKLLRYEQDWRGRWGVLDGERVYELVGDPFGECHAGALVAQLDELKLLAPCTPETIWSLGANYPSRLAERGFPVPTEPAFAVVPGSCICGTEAQIRIPEFEQRSEYGVELGIVVRSSSSGPSTASNWGSWFGATAAASSRARSPSTSWATRA
jgi:2-keto-4-pentenoate hydratase/2-oxohepta-3-ene-1,7-dioic acid hydratase in catechol pathway